MNENEDHKPVKCLSPLLFPATIFVLGLILNSILPQTVQAHWKFFCNLLMFCFGLIGWAFATCFIRKKRLHYGGTEIQEDSQRDGHIVSILAILLLVAFAVLVKSAITDIGVVEAKSRLTEATKKFTDQTEAARIQGRAGKIPEELKQNLEDSAKKLKDSQLNLEPKKGELRFGIIVVLVSFALFLMVLLAEIGWERPLKFIGFNNIFRGKSKEEIDDGLIPLISIFWLMVYIGIGSLDFAYQATSNSEMEAWMTIFYFFLWLFGFFAGRAMVLDRAQLQKQTDLKTWLIASLPIYVITWLLFILIFQQYTKFSSTGIVISYWKQDKFNFAFSLINMAWLLLFVPLLGGWIIMFTIEKNKKVKHIPVQ